MLNLLAHQWRTHIGPDEAPATTPHEPDIGWGLLPTIELLLASKENTF